MTCFHSVASEHVAGPVAGVENAVAEEHEHVTGLGFEGELVVLGIVEQSQRQAGGFDDFDLAVVDSTGDAASPELATCSERLRSSHTA